MRRLLKAEFNSIYRKPKLYVLLAILIASFLLGVLIDHYTNGTTFGYGIVGVFYIFLAIILVTDVTHKEYKFHTMKNLIGSGFSRKEIFFGKYIVTLVVAISFMLTEEILKIVYAFINQEFSKKINLVVDGVDALRQIGMFSIIFIISMLVISDGLSLFFSFLYGVLLAFIVPTITVFIPQLPENASEKITATLLITSSAYIKTDKKDFFSQHLIPSGLIWVAIGVVLVVVLMTVGYKTFERKEFK